MQKIKVIAFDCDGVMFNSKKANKKYYNDLLKYTKFPKLSKKQIAFVHSHTLNEVLTYLFGNSITLKKIKKHIQKIDYNKFIPIMKIEPTLFFILKVLQPHIKTAIATNRTHNVQQILKYHSILNLFDFIVTSSDVKFPKPNPEMLIKIIKHFKIKSNEIIYIGDSKLDQIATYSISIPFISYRNKKLNAIAHIKYLKELKKLLNI